VALAITDPDRVSALVLLCPGISGYPWPEDPDGDAAFEKAADEGLEALARFAGVRWAAAGPTPEVDEQLLSGAAGWLATAEFEQENPPCFDRLGEIACPTSLLIGDLDRPALIECDLRSAARIPDCELIQVPGVDHLPPLRVPALVLETIRTTLARAA
jgi:3-oxoadipate enol-lactonase